MSGHGRTRPRSRAEQQTDGARASAERGRGAAQHGKKSHTTKPEPKIQPRVTPRFNLRNGIEAAHAHGATSATPEYGSGSGKVSNAAMMSSSSSEKQVSHKNPFYVCRQSRHPFLSLHWGACSAVEPSAAATKPLVLLKSRGGDAKHGRGGGGGLGPENPRRRRRRQRRRLPQLLLLAA